jgi:hypothetical protein
MLNLRSKRKENNMPTEHRRIQYGVWLRNGNELDIQEVVVYAVEAEEAGWDGVFVSDELSAGYSDPWTVLAAIAVQTEQIRLGTWITPIPNKLPWRLAHILASLDHLSNGRMLLGAGLGAPLEHKTFGGFYEPKALGRKYDEALEIITRLWTGKTVSFSGEFFNVDNGKLAVTPIQQPRIPILMGCWWPNKKPFRRAARWDGIMPYWPALVKQGTGPQGEQPQGSVEEELRELLAYYYGLTDNPGEVFLPDRPDDNYRKLCIELGATWLFSTQIRDIEGIRRGPPD